MRTCWCRLTDTATGHPTEPRHTRCDGQAWPSRITSLAAVPRRRQHVQGSCSSRRRIDSPRTTGRVQRPRGSQLPAPATATPTGVNARRHLAGPPPRCSLTAVPGVVMSRLGVGCPERRRASAGSPRTGTAGSAREPERANTVEQRRARTGPAFVPDWARRLRSGQRMHYRHELVVVRETCSYRLLHRMMPSRSMMNTARRLTPRSSFHTPNSRATAPLGWKSASSGKARPPSCVAHARCACTLSTLTPST